MRVAATKLPLKIFSSDRNAPNRISCAIAVRAERPLERDLGAHVARDDVLPRVDVGHDRDDEDVEEEAGDQRRVDGAS